MLKRRGYVNGLPMGENILFGAAMAMLCYYFFHTPGAFKKNYIQYGLSKMIG
jgi:hypothetical protein